jgi:hypothetical protein
MSWLCDASGNFADFYKATGQEVPGTGQSTGLPLTDIAFIGHQMYGTTLGSLYAIDYTTGASSLVDNYSFSDAITALVGHGGDLYAAANNSGTVYELSPSGAELGVYATIPYAAAGDLAWSRNTLYESVVLKNGHDALYDVTDHRLIGAFTTPSGRHLDHVFALTNNLPHLGNPPFGTFAIAGHNIYQIDLANAHLTFLSNNAASGLGPAVGGAWRNEGS